ncbi:MAG: hypothetical protein PHQ75_14245 [Thermoguttaceae bacterium]|nr:hypothetical protein [Thermoguttaceae bacterium]
MASRRNSSLSSSLELFLDTICNTFGGILFILIFVVVLLRMTQKQVQEAVADGVSQVEYAAVEKELTVLESDWQNISKQLSEQLELNARLLTPDKAKLYASHKELIEENKKLVEQINQTAKTNLEHEKEIKSLQERNASLQKEVKDLTTSISKQTADVAQRQQSIKELQDSQKEDSSLPQMSEQATSVVGLVIRYHRLYLWHRYSPDGFKLGLNTDDFTVVEETSSYVKAMPKPWHGLALRDNPLMEVQIRQLLSRFSPSRFYTALIVSPDSFEDYRPVARELKKLGFAIQPHVVSQDHGIVDRGGSDSSAQ